MPPQTAGRNAEDTAEMMLQAGDLPEKRPDGGYTNDNPTVPKEGGLTGWLVVLVSFLCNGVIFGIINCYGVLYVAFLQQMEESGVANAAFKCSLAGSLCTGLTFLVSAASGVLADHVGMRLTACTGALLASLGLFVSAFVSGEFEALLVTYGLLLGTGASLVYTPSLVVLGHYFERRLGLVNGICAMGSSVFTFIMPFVMTSLLTSVAIKGTLLVLAGMVGLLAPLVLLFRARHGHSGPADSQRTSSSIAWLCSQLINVHIWRNRRYLVWSIAVPLGLFGYFVPYVHLVQYVRTSFPSGDGTWLVPCLGATSGLGRLVFGRIADMPRFNKIVLQQVSFLVIGTLTITLAFCRSFPLLVVIVLAMGLFDGCFISLLGPIAFELVGPTGASQAIGFLLTLCSVPLTVGPPVAGALYDHTHSYQTAFVLAGCPPILAALAMCLIHRIAPQPAEKSQCRRVSAALADGHEQLPQCEQLLGAAAHAI